MLPPDIDDRELLSKLIIAVAGDLPDKKQIKRVGKTNPFLYIKKVFAVIKFKAFCKRNKIFICNCIYFRQMSGEHILNSRLFNRFN